MRTYGKIYLDEDKTHWKINNAEPHVCIKLKAVFAKLSASATQPFTFDNTPEVCQDLLWFTDRYPLAISEADMALMKREKKKHVNNVNDIERILLPDYQPRELTLNEGYEARHYQLTGVDVYMKVKRLLIGDDIGLGKTLIGILSCLHKETRPCAAVVQTHLPKQWKASIEMFTGLTVHLIKGTKPYDLPPADIYIFKYSCLAGWVNVFEKGIFKSAIFDEVQELRHYGTGKYDGAMALSRNVEYCLGLSATPIYNYGDEIYNVLNVIKEKCLGNKYDFLREWTGGWKTVREPQALGTYLRENFLLLRRTRAEVGRELPPINKIVHTVGYNESEVRKSEEIAKQLAIRATSGSFVERGQAARELDIFVRQATGVSKAVEVAAYVRILLENNEPIVLAGWHREVYDIWMRELKEFNPVMFTGSETPAQKEEAKRKFVSGETNLFIISLRSGIGLDGLQNRSNIVVLGELDWSPKVHDQLIGRLDRDGQQEQVTAIYLVSDFGSDPLIIDMLGVKSSQSHNIINPLTAVAEQYTDESRLKLLAERFLNKKNEVVLDNGV